MHGAVESYICIYSPYYTVLLQFILAALLRAKNTTYLTRWTYYTCWLKIRTDFLCCLGTSPCRVIFKPHGSMEDPVFRVLRLHRLGTTSVTPELCPDLLQASLTCMTWSTFLFKVSRICRLLLLCLPKGVQFIWSPPSGTSSLSFFYFTYGHDNTIVFISSCKSCCDQEFATGKWVMPL